jgi:RimJ/RimL family protein N-acetyltransferase
VPLRPLEESDTPAVYRMLSDMEIIRYMSFQPHSLDDAREFVREARSTSGDEHVRYLVQGIAVPGVAETSGLAGLVIRPRRSDAEAWYLLDKPYWGRGLATEAARDLLDLGFGKNGLHRIWATVCPENPASVRVLEKADFRREGFLLRGELIHGEWRDVYLYAILREEWR